MKTKTIIAIISIVAIAAIAGFFIFDFEIENGNGITYPYIGDMNGDGVLNTVDGLYLLNHIDGKPGYEILHDSGDINCDGVIDQDDVDYLGNHLTGNPDYAILYDGCKP